MHFQLANSNCYDFETICSFYHNQIGILSHYPFCRVRWCDNGLRCMSCDVFHTIRYHTIRYDAIHTRSKPYHNIQYQTTLYHNTHHIISYGTTLFRTVHRTVQHTTPYQITSHHIYIYIYIYIYMISQHTIRQKAFIASIVVFMDLVVHLHHTSELIIFTMAMMESKVQCPDESCSVITVLDNRFDVAWEI